MPGCSTSTTPLRAPTCGCRITASCCGSRRSATLRGTEPAAGSDGRNGVEPIGSMGTDTPIAVLSARPRMLFDYFQQLFAQVTNPPLDAIREEVVTSLVGNVGPEGDLLNPTPDSAGRSMSQPILRNQ